MPKSFTCLIVEDDQAFAGMIDRIVRDFGGKTVLAGNLADATEAASTGQFDLMLLDNHLPDGKAYDFFERLSRRQPEAPVIMITGAPDLTEAIGLTRNGLFDYLTKPISTDALEACLKRALLRVSRASPTDATPSDLGKSPAMQEVMQQLQQAARHAIAAVLLTGESGVGKDVCARMLHRLSFGAQAGEASFVAVNCAALPAEMFEAELFGAERGSYTGADRRRTGLVGAAQKGTLFLDEVAEVPIGLQAKLLRFLEGREFRPLGSTESQQFSGRVVAATNKDLRAEVAAGRFREDLLFRIEVFQIVIPPLRTRRDEIPRLAEELLRHLIQKYERRPLLLRSEDLAALQRHDFPGNARELRNILERSLLRTPEDSRWLMLDRTWIGGRSTASVAPPVAPVPAPAPTASDPLPPDRADLTPLEAQEYCLIRSALMEAHGGIRRAAAKIGLSPQGLLRRLEKWPELRPPAKP